ncbi:3-phosphoserine/phosphohydroxythreonine transaminase [Buchnera aphidicola]|uniref:Phosphoserine aminotransferase n=1 Tax=Buchnera aphidicola (Stegophylla sp.) TaxID=2315800 RepID=A0A4D6YEE7_9GAMM|nr:3-phosphoserine/phosphohydroxythreonine transaminase [Buchnera aphidicola (Stegophylla sp.)]QCI26373.1 3-phosphoserine/phosphohydroxythreonine transaminase [Buchnera aphidicola (Stegophylla sp.)]
MNTTIYNFSAGPSMLPQEVLQQVQNEFLNWNNIGTSIIEISHRSLEFQTIVQELEQYLRELLDIPDQYTILFCSGGARGQFDAIPLNLLGNDYSADYVNSGYWSNSAMLEAKKYCLPRKINVISQIENKISIMPMKEWNLSNNTAYIHYCPNETIEGIAIYEEPNFDNKIIVGDFSSCILSRKINIQKYDLIYASTQKNIGPSGMTVIILKHKLLNIHNKLLFPSILNYKTLFKYQSMFNTPVTFSWYVSGLVLKWIKKQGGIHFFEKLNFQKSKLLYDTIDHSNLYINNIHQRNRSNMNVTFKLKKPHLNNIFLKKLNKHGLKFLKGHKIVGGFRASIYNAMPISGVQKLVQFMIQFEKKYG